MDRIPPRLWRLPNRQSPTRARLLIGLSLTSLAFVVLGLVLYDGWYRVTYTLMFVSVGLSNFAWGLGSLMPEERGGKAARFATLPLGILMFLGIIGWLAIELIGAP